MHAIELRDVVKRYGSRAALDHVSISLPQGASLGLLGPNGAGKTTALRLILGFARPSSGGVLLQGRDPRDPQSRQAVGYLPERLELPAQMSVQNFLRLHSRLAGIAPERIEGEIDEVCELTGLADRTRDQLGGLSKGLAQRVGFAQAFLGRPKLLLLDEPSSGLDPIGMREAREWIDRARGWGCSILISSHVLSEVERICERVAILADGHVAAEGTIADIVQEGSSSRTHSCESSAAAAGRAALRARELCDERSAQARRTRSNAARFRHIAPTIANSHARGTARCDAPADHRRRFAGLFHVPLDDRRMYCLRGDVQFQGNAGGEGGAIDPLALLAYAGIGGYLVLSLWIITLAGLLASDHLSETLQDGTALLILSRPVSRETFALSRLLGAWSVAMLAGSLLLGGTAAMLVGRHDLAAMPAVYAGLACALSAICIAALAMLAALFLPRVATFMLVFFVIAAISIINMTGIAGTELSGLSLWVDELGPPLATSITLALSAWADGQVTLVGGSMIIVRSFLWAAASVAALLFAFARLEISAKSSQWS